MICIVMQAKTLTLHAYGDWPEMLFRMQNQILAKKLHRKFSLERLCAAEHRFSVYSRPGMRGPRRHAPRHGIEMRMHTSERLTSAVANYSDEDSLDALERLISPTCLPAQNPYKIDAKNRGGL